MVSRGPVEGILALSLASALETIKTKAVTEYVTDMVNHREHVTYNVSNNYDAVDTLGLQIHQQEDLVVIF